jgi:hypothetical protein
MSKYLGASKQRVLIGWKKTDMLNYASGGDISLY